MEATSTFLTTTPPLYLNINYKRPILTAVHRPNPLAIVPNLYLAPALYLVSTIYKDEALTNAL
jgi:hypothetical protein